MAVAPSPIGKSDWNLPNHSYLKSAWKLSQDQAYSKSDWNPPNHSYLKSAWKLSQDQAYSKSDWNPPNHSYLKSAWKLSQDQAYSKSDWNPPNHSDSKSAWELSQDQSYSKSDWNLPNHSYLKSAWKLSQDQAYSKSDWNLPNHSDSKSAWELSQDQSYSRSDWSALSSTARRRNTVSNDNINQHSLQLIDPQSKPSTIEKNHMKIEVQEKKLVNKRVTERRKRFYCCRSRRSIFIVGLVLGMLSAGILLGIVLGVKFSRNEKQSTNITSMISSGTANTVTSVTTTVSTSITSSTNAGVTASAAVTFISTTVTTTVATTVPTVIVTSASSLISSTTTGNVISTSSTTPLMATTVSSTPSTSTAATTTITPVLICANYVSNNSVLYFVRNPLTNVWTYPSYIYYSYSWTANSTSAKLAFYFRHDPDGWMLDDITVSNGSSQLIVNGGFETGDLTGWNYSLSGGRCNNYIGQAYKDSLLSTNHAHSGTYYYYDRCADSCDVISQSFSTVPGGNYLISFYMTNYGCCGTTEIAAVTIT